jgi:cyclophilin family peptidyl-prolyl cis-trans isomerase
MRLLETWASRFDKEEQADWHLPARALAALARLAPDEARRHVPAALKSPFWQVRAGVAALAPVFGDERVALAVAADREPNVQAAALDALSRMKSASVVPAAIAALDTGRDYQLLRTAAMVLHLLPEEAREEATVSLLGALRRLTDEATDTSRDPRVAIIERLAETMRPERSSDLLDYTSDYDDAVVAAASKAFEALAGAPPAERPKRRRYPYQPTADQLAHLPSEAAIRLEDGVVTLRLLVDVAPVTVARFAELAAQGFYTDRTFHRVVPNFVVQGGSPGANEYVGAARYLRDEVGPQGVNVRGAVGISSRGGDTGDGQIFIDLVDLPRLDRDYTVFAYVTQGMELVDRLLEGAKILGVTVK